MDIQERYATAIHNGLLSIEQHPFSDEDAPTNPLLLVPPEGYEGSGLKVMYFGQETNGWEGGFGDCDTDELLGLYDGFANKGGGFKYGGHFWNGIRHFQGRFEQVDPTSKFLWNNLIKIGKDGDKGRPSARVLEWQEEWFDVIRCEVEVFQPHVVAFMTGPNYDDMIEHVFGPISMTPLGAYSQRELSRVKAQGLPEHTFRTYHPNYLWRFGLPDVCEAIIAEI